METLTQTTKPDATRGHNGLDLTLRDPTVRDHCLATQRKPNRISEIACLFFVLSLKSSQNLSLTGPNSDERESSGAEAPFLTVYSQVEG
jgi:hypothetical protein